jgi:glycosyltransferase involved in cell wall biosynthesis
MNTCRTPKTVLFHRSFKQFSGGHLKVWHYFRHLQESKEFQPEIFFSEESVWNSENPWLSQKALTQQVWSPQTKDILFLAGLDWLKLDKGPPLPSRIPIVNLIQHVRHADPRDIRFRFLSNKAVRICVSEPVAESLRATGRVNGPVFTVANGIDLSELPPPIDWDNRETDLTVFGLKNNALAKELSAALKKADIDAEIQLTRLPRKLFLDKLRNSKFAVLIPHETEGFFLPVLESMALNTLLICPDCKGNRSFCSDGINCFMPNYRLDDILQSTLKAYSLEASELKKLLTAGRQTVQNHSWVREKNEVLSIMKNLDNIW